MPKAIHINKKSDRNRNAMKISRLVGLNSKAELLILRSYFLVFRLLFHLSLSLKNMAVICNSALLFIFSYSFSLYYYSTTLQLDGGEWYDFRFSGYRSNRPVYLSYTAASTYSRSSGRLAAIRRLTD